MSGQCSITCVSMRHATCDKQEIGKSHFLTTRAVDNDDVDKWEVAPPMTRDFIKKVRVWELGQGHPYCVPGLSRRGTLFLAIRRNRFAPEEF